MGASYSNLPKKSVCVEFPTPSGVIPLYERYYRESSNNKVGAFVLVPREQERLVGLSKDHLGYMSMLRFYLFTDILMKIKEELDPLLGVAWFSKITLVYAMVNGQLVAIPEHPEMGLDLLKNFEALEIYKKIKDIQKKQLNWCKEESCWDMTQGCRIGYVPDPRTKDGYSIYQDCKRSAYETGDPNALLWRSFHISIVSTMSKRDPRMIWNFLVDQGWEIRKSELHEGVENQEILVPPTGPIEVTLDVRFLPFRTEYDGLLLKSDYMYQDGILAI